MNDLAALGVEIPSIPYIAGLIVFGIVGWVVFRRGRKLSNSVLTWSGEALMVYPYAVSDALLLWAVGAALCAWVYAKWV